jgi:hypothetical protein
MGNCALTLVQLSQIALAAGMNVGFNAVEVQRLVNIETDSNCLCFIWGDQAILKACRFRTPMEYALSYSNEIPCSREPCQRVFPESVAYEASYDLKTRFTEALLETVDV